MAATNSNAEIKLPIKLEGNQSVIKLMERAQWLRAAILGVNDGLLSTTSLMLGVGAAKEDQRLMIVSGFAGAVAGACSMAVGEFVSVSTQRDIERMSREKSSDVCLSNDGGVTAKSYGDQSILGVKENKDIVGGSKEKISLSSVIFSSPHRSPIMKIIATDGGINHVEGEGYGDGLNVALPNPYKAATASGIAFLCGSIVPILSAMVFSRHNTRVIGIVVLTSIALTFFGAVGARFGGSPASVSAMRVLVGGWISMAIAYGLLKPFDRDDKGHDVD